MYRLVDILTILIIPQDYHHFVEGLGVLSQAESFLLFPLVVSLSLKAA